MINMAHHRVTVHQPPLLRLSEQILRLRRYLSGTVVVVVVSGTVVVVVVSGTVVVVVVSGTVVESEV